MTLTRNHRRRILLSASLAAAFVAACAATRQSRDSDVIKHSPTPCGSLAPCPYDWPR